MRRTASAIPPLLALLLLAPAGSPQEEKKPAQDTLPEKTRKHKLDVTRLRGLDFKKEVTVGVYSKKELAEFLKTELEKDFPREKAERFQRAYARFGLIPEDMDLFQAFLDLYGGSIAGFYHPKTKELRLVRAGEDKEDEEGQFKAMGIDLEAVTLVHELTHAAQDQHFELSTLPLEDETNDDLIMALKGVIEGDASAVGWKFAFKGLFNAWMPRYNALLKEGDLPGKAGEMPPYLRLTLTFPYGHGTDFVLKYLKVTDGDFKDCSKLFDELPLSSEQILHPEKYYDADKRDWPTLVTLPSLPPLLGAGWKETLTNVHGEFVIDLLLRELTGDKEAARRASEGWDGDRYAAFEDADKGTLIVWYSTWDSERDAREFYETYVLALAKRHALPAPDPVDPAVTTLRAKSGTVRLERQGKDVLLLDGTAAATARVTEGVWKGARKSELSKLERLRKFVCDGCSVKEAFSGACPKCKKALRFDDPDPAPTPGEKKGPKKSREY